MRIAIDMQGAQAGNRLRGIGRYTLSLVEALLRNAPENEYFLVQNGQLPTLNQETSERLSAFIPSENILTFASLSHTSWEGTSVQWRRYASELSRELFMADLSPDIVLVTSLFEGYEDCDSVSSIAKLASYIPTAVIFYDLIPFLNPDKYLATESINAWYQERLDNLKRADILLAISEYAVSEGENFLNLEEGKVLNIGTSYVADFFKPVDLSEKDRTELRTRYGITDDYLMYNGSLEARKNPEGLIHAYSLLNESLKNTYQLVLVGEVSSKDQQRMLHVAREFGCEDRIVLTGYVEDADLLCLFNLASLFVFPSFHEGFGLPALEAMACGTPTIGSNVTSIPEVIGREDALFDPESPSAIAEAITRVLSDDVFKKDLQEYALERSKTFSWDKVARRVLDALVVLGKRKEIRKLNWKEFITHHRENYVKLLESLANFERNDADLRLYANILAKNIETTQDLFRKQGSLPGKLDWRIEGPFDSSYSLALLNRETALALHRAGHNVALHSTEGPGDFPPSSIFLDEHPLLEKLHRNCVRINSLQADITSRNLYPPRVSDMLSRYNMLHHFAWEETALPQEWVEQFNIYLQGITCLSSHVKKILIDNGVTVPLSISGCGVDHWERTQPDHHYSVNGKSFKFLHVSSCFPRKGVDKLLDAYFQEFSVDDDCTLIIKTFPNPHNEIKSMLEEKQKNAELPHVVLVDQEISESQMKALYKLCDAMVVPSRAEGFALPLAEAMLSGLDVITTAWGGQMDFCTPETAWLVDYELDLARSHISQFDSVWAEPNVDHLARVMRELYRLEPDSRGLKSIKGRQQLLRNFRWENVTARLVDAVYGNAAKSHMAYPRTGWVTTWNTQCGIATYSQHLLEKMTESVHVLAAHVDNPNDTAQQGVSRCWEAGETDNLSELADMVDKLGLEALVIQFNYSLFNFEFFGRFIDRQVSKGKTIILTLHSTCDPVEILPHKRLAKIKLSLSRCHRILVHSVKDLNRLKALGLVENVTLFPHGIKEFAIGEKAPSSMDAKNDLHWQIASYGFFLPHKGLIELIDACSILRRRGCDVSLNMINSEYPVPESAALIRHAQCKVAEMNLQSYVKMETKFLPDNESFIHLSDADMLVFPYQETGESASGAVRYGLATGKPVAVTPLPIFEDVHSLVYQLPGITPEEIADGIEQIMEDIRADADHVREIATTSECWRREHTYSRLGRRLQDLIYALHQEHNQG